MTDLVSGEAVVLELRLAKLPSRALALIIDIAVQLALLIGLVALGALVPTPDRALGAAIALVALLMIAVGYPVTVETLTRGRSLGKLALGLRVVRDDGGPIRFRHALTRGLAGFLVDIWTLGLLGVGLIASLISPEGKRIGDMLAGTVVIRERMPAQGGYVPQMPRPLAGWAAGLELSALPDDLALAARQFLSRIHQLAPAVAEGMAARLAGDVARYVRPAAPPGTPSWAYLAAVVVERRNREMSRMVGQRGYGGAAPAFGSGSPPQVPAPRAHAGSWGHGGYDGPDGGGRPSYASWPWPTPQLQAPGGFGPVAPAPPEAGSVPAGSVPAGSVPAGTDMRPAVPAGWRPAGTDMRPATAPRAVAPADAEAGGGAAAGAGAGPDVEAVGDGATATASAARERARPETGFAPPR